MRIVSLVPSLTETLVGFGLLDSLVGRTRYCCEPAPAVERVETVGGTKNPEVARIVLLRPDLVVVNAEENRLEDFRALRAAGLRLHVTHPRSVAEAADMLEALGQVCGRPEAGAELAARCRAALARAQAARARRNRRVRTFCPIWRRPYMTFRDDTYAGDMLVQAGCENVFGTRPGPDFFEVDVEEVRAAEPQLIVLPDEPYAFAPEHARELHAVAAGAAVVFVDGKDLAWYGSRIPRALEVLAEAVRAADRGETGAPPREAAPV